MLRLNLNFVSIGVFNVICVFACLVLTALSTSPAFASQLPFIGRVHDQGGAVLPGATVTAVPDPPGATLTAVADQRGEFRMALEPRGYQFTIALDGFVTLTERIVPSAVSSQERGFILKVPGVTETVKVIGQSIDRVAAVSSAMKTPTPLRDIPQSITVVSAALIAEQRMQGMADVVRYMPGVGMAQGEGNRDTPILRGNSSTGDFYVDGVRDDAQYFRDTYNVDHVEALKGPNAMIFGRGGGGGVINRVSRQADWSPVNELDIQLGSFGNRRATIDLGAASRSRAATRLTALYENSDSYRSEVTLERAGVNPTVAVALGSNTMLRAGYEFFRDHRTADRGIPSFNGRPVETDPSTFFGDPARGTSRADVNLASIVVEHNPGHGVTVRSRTSFADYDKFYQNLVPGAVSGGMVSVSGYNNSTERQNVFHQTDAIVTGKTGAIGHVIATGIEVGRQLTDNFRNTAYFTTLGANVTTILAPLSSPVTTLPIDFRQSATDADNSGTATIAAVYAQDQLALTKHVNAVVGLRFDSFNVDFTNHRGGATFASHDGLLSPRIGLIVKPAVPVSLYASYSLANVPRAGDQLSSLSLSNQSLDPEEFRNYEVGAKWDTGTIAVSIAGYRLDRGNVAVADPVDPTRSILVDAQRTKGLELAVDGRVTSRWTVAGGYAFQEGKITRSISANAQAGAALAQLPRHSFSLWNRYDVSRRVGAGLGVIHRDDVFAASDNLVTLPSFTRIDAGVFWTLTRQVRSQVNVENLFDARYFASAHNNANIQPGSPRAIRVAMTTRF
jgi:catecholate siderophore receptor